VDTCTHCHAPIPSWIRAAGPESMDWSPQATATGGFLATLLWATPRWAAC
jgi:hypothetical protein